MADGPGAGPADTCADGGGWTWVLWKSSTCSLLYPEMLRHFSSPYVFHFIFLFVLVLEFEPRISQIPRTHSATQATLAETKLLNGTCSATQATPAEMKLLNGPPDVFLHICQSFLSGQSL